MLQSFYQTLILAGLVLILWLLLRGAVNQLAKRDKWFTFREEGRYKYHLRGKKLVQILYRIPGIVVDQRTYKVRHHRNPEHDEQWNLIEWIFGAYFIGFEEYNILRYNIVYGRPWRPGDDVRMKLKPGAFEADKAHNFVRRYTKTTYHAHKFVYSIFVPNVEIKGREVTTLNKTTGQLEKVRGQARIHVFGTITVETVDAYLPVMFLHGMWFSNLEDAIRGAFNDFFNPKTLDEINELEKAFNKNDPDLQSELEQAVLRASSSKGGTENTVGLKITAFNFGGLDPEDKLQAAASLVAEQEYRTAAKIKEGEGQGEYNRLVTEGQAAGDLKIAEAFKDNPTAAYVQAARAKATGMEKLTGTYVEEGGGMKTLLSINAGKTQPLPSAPPEGGTGTQPAAGTQPKPGGGKPNPAPQNKSPQSPPPPPPVQKQNQGNRQGGKGKKNKQRNRGKRW